MQRLLGSLAGVPGPGQGRAAGLASYSATVFSCSSSSNNSLPTCARLGAATAIGNA